MPGDGTDRAVGQVSPAWAKASGRSPEASAITFQVYGHRPAGWTCRAAQLSGQLIKNAVHDRGRDTHGT